MRILKLIVIFMTIIVVLGSVFVVLMNRDIKDGPSIVSTIEGDIEASVYTTDEELLQFVTASDPQDGDISNKIKVVRKKYFIAEKISIVIFAVSDSDNNVDTMSKRIVYTDYSSPELAFKSDFIFKSGRSSGDLSNYGTAQDKFDGDLTAYVKIISTEFSTAVGQYPINMKVSNSMGDTEEITIHGIVTNDYNENVRINLNKYLMYYDGNPDIDWMQYVDGISNRAYSESEIVVDTSELDLSKPGVNNVYYRLVSDDNVVTYTRIIVVVKGA